MSSYVKIYRNRAADEFSVQPLGLHPDGHIVEAGAPTTIPASQFDQLITPAIEAALESFRIQTEEAEGRVMSDEEYEVFRGNHDGVTVIKTDKGRFEVVPFKRVAGGYRSIESKRVRLSRRPSVCEWVKALRTAFQQCVG